MGSLTGKLERNLHRNPEQRCPRNGEALLPSAMLTTLSPEPAGR